MSCSNQCCANTLSNSRCTNLTISGSSHCYLHRNKALNLYLKYKKFSDQADQLEIYKKFDNIQDQINYVMDSYILLDKTFNARTKHRMYAFVPECYDDGHDYQLIKLTKLMDECERILSELYILESSVLSETESSSESEEEAPSTVIITIKEKVKQCHKSRLDREREIEIWINKYIEENKTLLEQKRLLAYKISTYITELFDDDDIHIFVQFVILFTLAGRLRNIGYFEKTFKPDKCKHAGCNCCVYYDVALGCGCIIQNNTLEKYFTLSTEETLRLFYKTLLLNKTKLLPLIEDVTELYYQYGDEVMFMKVHLEWDQIQKRLTLREGLFEKKISSPKTSTILANSRLKNKYLQQKLNTMLLTPK